MNHKTDIPWDEVKREYLAGMQPAPLCKKFNINYKTLTGRITREGWKDTRKEIVDKIGEKIGDIEAIAIQQMREQERKHTDVMIKAILTRLILNGEINPMLNSQEISHLVSSYEKIQRMKYKSYGIADKLEHDHNVPTAIKFILERD